MKRDTKRRGWLYGGGIAAAALLLVLGFGVAFPPDVGTRLSGAAMLSGLGAHEDAIAEIDRALAEHPGSFDVLVYRAAILARAGRHGDALEAFDAALSHEEAAGSMARSLRQDRASLLLRMDRDEEFKRAREELAAGGTDRFVHALDGLAAGKRGDWKAAVRHWEDAYRAEENDQTRGQLYRALMELGALDVRERRFEDARKHYERARELVPGTDEPLRKSAEIDLAKGDPQAALATVADCRDGTPGVAPLRVRAATMLLEGGKVEEAYAALESAVRCDKKAAWTLVDADPVWKDLGDADRLAALR